MCLLRLLLLQLTDTRTRAIVGLFVVVLVVDLGLPLTPVTSVRSILCIREYSLTYCVTIVNSLCSLPRRLVFSSFLSLTLLKLETLTFLCLTFDVKTGMSKRMEKK